MAVNNLGLLNEITEVITNNFVIMMLVAIVVIIILLFASQFIFKNTKYAIFVRQRILGNPFVSLSAILLTIGLATIWIWWEFDDELTMVAWSVIMSNAVVILTITVNIIQTRTSFRQQTALVQLGLMPCLYLSKLQNTNKIIFESSIKRSAVINQKYEFECVRENPAFNVNWFLWTKAVKPYLYREYEKSKSKISAIAYTAVKGKSYEISFNLECANMEQVLVAEHKDISGIAYTQIFTLKLNKQMNMFEVDGVDAPTPTPPLESKNKK